MEIKTEQGICECGHKEREHNSWGTECNVIKHIKGSHYQCICRKFKLKGVIMPKGKKKQPEPQEEEIEEEEVEEPVQE